MNNVIAPKVWRRYGEERRRARRWDLWEKAELRVRGGGIAVIVEDLSPFGARLGADAPLAAGEAVVLTMSGCDPIPGLVRYASDGFCGVEFEINRAARARLVDWITLMLNPWS